MKQQNTLFMSVTQVLIQHYCSDILMDENKTIHMKIKKALFIKDILTY